MATGLYRTFKENYVPYFADGRGRDRYIAYNNSGFYHNYPDPLNHANTHRTGTVFYSKIYEHNKSPSVKTPNFHYHSDGNGRDQYILENGGGLYTDSKPLLSYRLTDFLRKHNYNYRNPKSRQKVALSRAELKYQKFLRNKEKEIISRLYIKEKDKFMKKLKYNPNKCFSSDEINSDIEPITGIKPNFKFKNKLNENEIDSKQVNNECFTPRIGNNKYGIIGNKDNMNAKSQNENPSIAKNLRLKPKIYIDSKSHNNLRNIGKGFLSNKTSDDFYNNIERIRKYQNMNKRNLLKIKKPPYFHILNEHSIKNEN